MGNKCRFGREMAACPMIVRATPCDDNPNSITLCVTRLGNPQYPAIQRLNSAFGSAITSRNDVCPMTADSLLLWSLRSETKANERQCG